MVTEEIILSDDSLDETKAELFAERMIEVLNDAALALMTSIGHRTNLFDVMAEMPPATSAEIAIQGKLNERYVREWLGAMVTGGIVEYDLETNTYRLPSAHAAFLTRAATPNNLAVGAQFIPILGCVEDSIIECFRNGGGVPYSSYPRFHEVMAEESQQTIVSNLVNSILPLVPDLTERLEIGIDVLDVGCGSGRAINALAAEYPRSLFSGYDFSEEGISAARREAEQKGLTNVNFEVKDASAFDEPHNYDLITAFDSIHDQAEPGKVLLRISKALRPDGVFLMQDIKGSSHVHKDAELPLAPFLYTISCMHCMSVSLAYDGKGLGAMWGEEQAQRMLKDAGFRHVEINQLPHDIMNSYYVATKIKANNSAVNSN